MQITRRHGICLHSDACLGGFVLPFARRLGYNIPAFDFSVPGVTSMSADTHKFGMAHKARSLALSLLALGCARAAAAGLLTAGALPRQHPAKLRAPARSPHRACRSGLLAQQAC